MKKEIIIGTTKVLFRNLKKLNIIGGWFTDDDLVLDRLSNSGSIVENNICSKIHPSEYTEYWKNLLLKLKLNNNAFVSTNNREVLETLFKIVEEIDFINTQDIFYYELRYESGKLVAQQMSFEVLKNQVNRNKPYRGF